ncbi:hypothetical protein R5R35_009260 [Gryllus longicercus]|uniref:Signal recognition particle receptor alpha subunit N-terminal domain-containing protein n=1 Tax=Gryllus longicercus TaxID=2509291 RepID=A0AAN9Z0V2_9ORTH
MVNGEVKVPEKIKIEEVVPVIAPVITTNGELDEETLRQNRLRLAQKFGKSPQSKADKKKSPKPRKEGKKPRVWDLAGNSKDFATLDYTKDKPEDGAMFPEVQPDTTVRQVSSLHSFLIVGYLVELVRM